MQHRGPYQKQESDPEQPSAEIKKKLAAQIQAIKERTHKDKAERRARLKESHEITERISAIAPLSEAEEIARIEAGLPFTPSTDPREETIAWLIARGLPPLPVVPAYPAEEYPKRRKGDGLVRDEDGNIKPLFNGKCPSYRDKNGRPHLVNHKPYQSKMPDSHTLAKWFADPDVGVGTLGGDRIKFIDLDRKHFDSQEECDEAARERFDKLGGIGLLEQTRSGGWRIAVMTSYPSCDISITPDGGHKGELLGVGLFTVLAPTPGYRNFCRSPNIPEIEKLEYLDIFPAKPASMSKERSPQESLPSTPEKPQREKRYQKPDSGLDPYVRFPADCWQFYGAPMTLWLIARHFDPKGQGWAEFTLCAACAISQRKAPTIRKWLMLGRRLGLFRFTMTKGIPGVQQARIKIYYASIHKIAHAAGLENLGAVGLVNLETDIKNLRIKATEIIQEDLQRASRFAAYREELQAAEENNRQAVKPPKPEELVQPCVQTPSRVLWQTPTALGVSEGFVAYGSSQKTIASRRNLSTRSVRRHLGNSYRLEPSPVREFRKVLNPVVKKQLHQRLRYSIKSDFLSVAGEDRNKFFVDSSGRVWERKCSIFLQSNQLVKIKFQRKLFNLKRFITPTTNPHEGN